MRKIEKEHETKEVAQQEICYLCGERLDDGRPTNRDHVHPKSVFRREDRTVTLILPVHEECNDSCSISDEQTKQFVNAIHGPIRELPVKTRVAGTIVDNGQPTGILLEGLPLHRIVQRIMRGCHMALYGQALPMDFLNMILTPLPQFDLKTGQPSENNSLKQHAHFCRLLKLQRRTGDIDFISAYNGKFRFESVWGTVR
jgi:hypothetical protein